MLVGNFTPDDIKWTHLGIIGTITGNGKVEDFEENRAKHILTKFQKRGLLRVDFEDFRLNNLDKYREQAMQVYKQFWAEQIYTFNNQNNQRVNENKAYVYAPKHIVEKAKELGLEIIGPSKTTQKTDSQELKDVKAENKSLKEEMAEMRQAMKDLMAVVKAQPVREVVVDTNAILKQFQHLGKDRYKNWVYANDTDIPDYPFSVYESAFEKWGEFYPGEPWPVQKCRHAPNEVVTDDGDIQ